MYPITCWQHYRLKQARIRRQSESADAGAASEVPAEDNKDSDGEETLVTDDHAPQVQYPHNLTAGNMAFFIAVPTLCYELNYPRCALPRFELQCVDKHGVDRNKKIRKRFLARRIVECVLFSFVAVALAQQVLCVYNREILCMNFPCSGLCRQ